MKKDWLSFFSEILSLIKRSRYDCEDIVENIANITERHLNSDFVLIEIWNLKEDKLFCYALKDILMDAPLSIKYSPFKELILKEKPFSGKGEVISSLPNNLKDRSVLIQPVVISEDIKGIICVGGKDYIQFSENDKLKLSFIASIMSVIGHGRLLEGKFERLFDIFNILQILLPIIAEEIILEEEPDRLIIDFLNRLKVFFDADRCVFAKASGFKIQPVFHVGLELENRYFKPGKGIVGTIFETGKPLFVPDYQKFIQEQRIEKDDLPCDIEVIISGMGVPIKLDGKLIGVVALCRSREKAPYDEFDFSALKIFQDFMGLIFKVAKLREEKKKQEQLLNRVQRFESLGILAGGIAHDFNNILNVIIGLSEIAKMELQNEDFNKKQMENYINSIIEQAKLASGLTKQILDFAVKDTGHKQLLDLVPFIKGLMKMFSRTIRSDISVEFRVLDEGKYYILADPTNIQQVIMNMVLNAVDAISGEGTITLTLRKLKIRDRRLYPTLSPGDYVVLEIKDTGSGIPKDFMDKIFDPFFTTKPNGTGLGLSQAYGIIKNLKGEILVESEVGKGTTFTIIIPEAKAEMLEGEYKRADIVISGKGKVLIVEDRKELAQAISIALKMAGFDVDTAYSYKASLKFIENNAYDIIIADLVLPDGSGIDVVKLAKRKSPETKAVIISGYRPEGITEEKINKNADAFLSKPFTMSSLLETLRNMVEEKNA